MTLTHVIRLDTTVVAGGEQISCELADEAVVLSLRDGVYYGLNSVAARVWELVQEPQTVGEIREILMDEYEVDRESCTRDLLDLVDRLREWKLVELRNGDGEDPS